MTHVVVLFAMAVTCVITAVANVAVAKVTGLNLFTLKVFLIVPVGAVLAGMAAAGGAVLAARIANAALTKVDAASMVAVGAMAMGLIYYLDYVTFVLEDGTRASDLVAFLEYVDLVLTTAHLRIGRGARDVGEVGQLGYWLAAVEFGGFLVGGFGAFLIAGEMPRCATCGAYFRKLKKQHGGEVTLDEADALVTGFGEGDETDLDHIINWKPPEHKFNSNDKRAKVAFALLGCPKCKREQLACSVEAFDGRNWKAIDSLKHHRDLATGSSFRERFR